MSIWWQAIPYFLLGASEAFTIVGVMELFYSEVGGCKRESVRAHVCARFSYSEIDEVEQDPPPPAPNTHPFSPLHTPPTTLTHKQHTTTR